MLKTCVLKVCYGIANFGHALNSWFSLMHSHIAMYLHNTLWYFLSPLCLLARICTWLGMSLLHWHNFENNRLQIWQE